jgi:hypothetical protein
MVRGVSSKTEVKRSRDEALEHIKLALRTKSNLFTRQEMCFIRTSCHILGVDGNAMAKAVANEVKDNGIKQPRKVMEYLQSRLVAAGPPWGSARELSLSPLTRRGDPPPLLAPGRVASPRHTLGVELVLLGRRCCGDRVVFNESSE